MVSRNPVKPVRPELSPESEYVVRRSLKELLDQYRADWPLDAFELVKTINGEGRIEIDLQWVDPGILKDAGTDGFTKMMADGRYAVFMAQPAPDWRTDPVLRRCNFTLAHELGHIFCRHLEYRTPDYPGKLAIRDDMEANAFAARLLMPEGLIRVGPVRSVEALAEGFLTSREAAFRRLEELGMLNALSGRYRDVCADCGNDRLQPGMEWCDICGQPVFLPKYRHGVLAVPYARAETDRLGRVLRCPKCGAEDFGEYDLNCPGCGTPLRNLCDEITHSCNHVNSPGARCCELCGLPTLYGNLGLLPPWQEEREAWIRAAVNPGGGPEKEEPEEDGEEEPDVETAADREENPKDSNPASWKPD